MKAGTNMRSAKLSQRNFAISEVRTKPPACARATRCGQRVRRVNDVGVGEQQIVRRRRRALGLFDALLLRPQLAGPAGRQGAPGQYGQTRAGAERRRGLARHRRGGVAALVVDQDHAEGARIVLPQQRAYGLARRIRPRRAPG